MGRVAHLGAKLEGIHYFDIHAQAPGELRGLRATVPKGAAKGAARSTACLRARLARTWG
jgi:hypothetical protein